MDIPTHAEPIVLRGVNENDANGIMTLLHQSGRGSGDKDGLLWEIRRLNARWTIAYSGAEVCGYTSYRILKDRLCLMDVLVRPDYRRRGIGRQLLEAVVAKCVLGQRQYVEAIIDETELASCQFLRACGFVARLPMIASRFAGPDGIRFVHYPLTSKEAAC